MKNKLMKIPKTGLVKFFPHSPWYRLFLDEWQVYYVEPSILTSSKGIDFIWVKKGDTDYGLSVEDGFKKDWFIVKGNV